MTTPKHISFLRQNEDLLKGPILIVGSKMYPYDQADPRDLLTELSVGPVTGFDLEAGPGVDVVGDICNPSAEFLDEHRGKYQTVLFMEVLTHVDNPFTAAGIVADLLVPGGTVLLSECIVRKQSRMPNDNWRFTYSGFRLLFPAFEFHDDRARFSIVRAPGAALLPLSNELPQVMDGRHADESRLGHVVRRVHRKLLAHGVFEVSRLMPETAVMAVATKAQA